MSGSCCALEKIITMYYVLAAGLHACALKMLAGLDAAITQIWYGAVLGSGLVVVFSASLVVSYVNIWIGFGMLMEAGIILPMHTKKHLLSSD